MKLTTFPLTMLLLGVMIMIPSTSSNQSSDGTGVNAKPQELELGDPIDVPDIESFDNFYQVVLLELPIVATQLGMFPIEINQFVNASSLEKEGKNWRITMVVKGNKTLGYKQSEVTFEVFQPPPEECTNGEHICVEDFRLIRHPTQETIDLHDGRNVLPNFEVFAYLYQVTKASVPHLKSLLTLSDLSILHFEKASHQMVAGTKWIITIDILGESKLDDKPLKVEFEVLTELPEECKPGANICVKYVEVLNVTTLEDGEDEMIMIHSNATCMDQASNDTCGYGKQYPNTCAFSYYRENCKQSCHFCEETPCEDINPCESVKELRKCSDAMTRWNCKRSCEVCGQDKTPCYDELYFHTRCQILRDRGFCKNDTFTRKYCKKTCEECESTEEPEEIVTPPCEDISISFFCNSAIKYGRCDETWYKWNCKKTCSACEEGTI